MTTTDVIAFAGEEYPIQDMSTEALNELYRNIVDTINDCEDQRDMGTITLVELDNVRKQGRQATKAIDAVLTERRQTEKLESYQAELSAETRKIIETMLTNEHYLLLQLETYLEVKGYCLSDFDTAKGSRIDAAWQIASTGRFKLPADYTGSILVDSVQTEPGNYAYSVYHELAGHGGNQCICPDAAYHAGRKGIMCKHVLSAMLVWFACELIRAQAGWKVAA